MSTAPLGRPRPFVLIIMDGWGINPRKEGNAIALAHTPNIDKIAREWPHTAVKTSGALRQVLIAVTGWAKFNSRP